MVDNKPKVTKDLKKNDGEQKVTPIGPTDIPARPGYKAYTVLGSRFELPENYEIIDPVGSGAYGVVIAAKDKSEED